MNPEVLAVHSDACRRLLVDIMTGMGCEVIVSTAAPLTETDYDPNPISCPHGVVYYMQPTNDQIIRWRNERVL